MSGVARVVAIGERARVEGLALAGVQVLVAEDASAVAAAWESLGGDVAVAVLSPAAAAALAALDGPWRGTDIVPGRPIPVVMPP